MHIQGQGSGKRRWPGGFWRSFIAIVAGNTLYYSLLRYLPEAAQHQPFLLDWGLVVDLWFCVAVYGLTLLFWPLRKGR
ncbi:MAG: hypothetical protein WD733_23970 [Bryobacterales bacterium]